VAAAGSRGGSGSGTGGRVVPSPAGRGEFIAYLIENFSSSRMRVESGVLGFILEQVVVSEREWIDGYRSGRLDVDWFVRKLGGALELGAQRAERAGAYEIDVALAEGVYRELQQNGEECRFPFRIICS
jgi:hypothetical protein